MKKVWVMGWCVALLALSACGEDESQLDAAVDPPGQDGSVFDAGAGLTDAAPDTAADAAPDAMPPDCTSSADCDDSLECTDDICNDQGTCENPIDITNTCSDGDLCTTTDACLANGICQGQLVTCDDSDTCTDDACNPANGQCVFDIDTTNTCTDGNACTSQDSCQGDGSCQGQVVTCNDSNSCTDDSCNPVDGQCVFSINTSNTCSDGNLCTSSDSCLANGTCRGQTLICDDANACTDDSCNPANGQCVAVVDTSNPCNDGDSCTTQDACQANGSCLGDDLVCDDSDVCTLDYCDSNAPSEATACMADQVNNGSACDFFGQGCATISGILDDLTPTISVEFWLRPENVAGTVLDGQFFGVEGFIITRTPDTVGAPIPGVLTYEEVGSGTPITLPSPNGQWHHYAFYHVGTNVHSWFDGAYQGQETGYPVWSSLGQTNLFAGCEFNEATGGISNTYLGDLDELHLASAALYSPGTSFPPTAQAFPTTASAGLYRCDSASVFEDSSTAGNDGSAVSGGWALTSLVGLTCPEPL